MTSPVAPTRASWPPDLLAGQVALVTGGASGLGRASALALGSAGVHGVVVADLEPQPREGGRPTTELLADLGVATTFVRCDVTRREDITAAVSAADVLGGVTIVVTAAGIVRVEDVLDVTEADLDVMMDVNLKGTFLTAQLAAQSMVQAGRPGSIVTINSVGGVIASASLPTYNISKGAARMLAYSFAASLGPRGIRVNAVHPGVTRTAMTTLDSSLAGDREAAAVPLRRIGEPQDVANAVVYLASPLASYVSGTSLFVDGGAHSSKVGRDVAAM